MTPSCLRRFAFAPPSRVTAKDVAANSRPLGRMAGNQRPGIGRSAGAYLRTTKINGNFVVPPSELARLPDWQTVWHLPAG